MRPATGNGSRGAFVCALRGDPMLCTRGDGLLSTDQAARLAGVAPGTIRSWRSRKRLAAAGLDDHGRPLYEPDAVREAEALVRSNGLRTSGIDPRKVRQVGRSCSGDVWVAAIGLPELRDVTEQRLSGDEPLAVHAQVREHRVA